MSLPGNAWRCWWSQLETPPGTCKSWETCFRGDSRNSAGFSVLLPHLRIFLWMFGSCWGCSRGSARGQRETSSPAPTRGSCCNPGAGDNAPGIVSRCQHFPFPIHPYQNNPKLPSPRAHGAELQVVPLSTSDALRGCSSLQPFCRIFGCVPLLVGAP